MADAMSAEPSHEAATAEVPSLPKLEYAPPTCAWAAHDPAPAFYDAAATFPFIAPILEQADAIFAELKGATHWFDWPEQTLYDKSRGHSWKVLPFCHTFPAYDATKTQWIPDSEAACPRTAALLRSIPGIRTALFSRMGPKTTLAAHQGWADLSNHVLRVHLPLFVPDEDARPCGVVVGDEIQYHKKGQFIVFDDSKLHWAFNNHPTETRYVLIFDLARPPGLPRGQASGATTSELESLIDYFK
jgi:aspartyl/asparaginyl beta-hydroxylase (cupin superfamily)